MNKLMVNLTGKAILTLSFFALALTGINAQCFLNDENILVDATGQPCPNSIVSAVPFLRITADARSGAMGDAGIAISADANAMQYNASKLAFAEQPTALSVTYTPWLRALGLQDVYLAYLSGYTKLSDLEAIGVSLRYFSLGSISFTDVNGEPLGTGNPNEFELKTSYARKLTDNLSAAVGAKFIYSNLAAGQTLQDGNVIEAGLAGAADVSFTYEKELKNDSDLRVGLAFSNIGSKITYTNSINRDFLPANLGLGAAWELALDDYNRLTITGDINKALVPTPCIGVNGPCDENNNAIPDFKEQSPISAAFGSFSDAEQSGEEFKELAYSLGLEYWYDEQFAVRAGYYTEHATKGNRRYLTVGLGLKYNVFGLNFSYLVPTTNQRNPLDNTLRFSLLFNFADATAAE